MEYHQNILHDMPQGMSKGCLKNLESTLETFAKLRVSYLFWAKTNVVADFCTIYVCVCVCVCVVWASLVAQW